MEINDILNLLMRQLGRADVHADHRLIEDLGVESADMVNIIATLEEDYNIYIEEESIADLRTVADVYNLVRQHLA